VAFNSLAVYAPEPNPETKKKDVVWFALNEDRPLIAFAEFKVAAAPKVQRGRNISATDEAASRGAAVQFCGPHGPLP
jgi:hypothetical protein